MESNKRKVLPQGWNNPMQHIQPAQQLCRKDLGTMADIKVN